MSMPNYIEARVVDSSRIAQVIEAKILAPEALTELGQQIVLTKGVFDILHSGHLHLFAFCRTIAEESGGLVVVAVASDADVRSRKGPGRPIQSQEVRLRQIAALENVDYVFVYGPPCLPDAINSCRPSCFVKGVDTARYVLNSDGGARVDSSLGGDVFTAHQIGAEIVLFSDDGSLSTTDLLATILEKQS